MSDFTQENRFIKIETPLGKDVFLMTEFKGIEHVSSLFSFDLAMLSEDHDVVFSDIIGKSVTVSIMLNDDKVRYINGIVSSFEQGRSGGESGETPHFSYYKATMVPWLWMLTRTTDSRIFQEMSVPDIVEQILGDQGFSDYKLDLKGSYDKRTYCVQYNETDFNFISRLLEEEGIFYFFEHEDGKHTLLIGDDPEINAPVQEQEEAQFHLGGGNTLIEDDLIHELNMRQKIMPAKYTLNDYNFEAPDNNLVVETSTSDKIGPGEREVYDYPGSFQKRDEGDHFCMIRMEEKEARITTISGKSSCRAFTSGYRFTLTGFYRDDLNDKDYVLTSISHQANQGYELSGDSDEVSYKNRFSCIPFEVPYRPERKTRRPVIRGSQTAIVVGPSGEEIYPDEFGRVKVQFHWDREGKNDEKSSCWIRVSQAWAGAGWGSMHIPHIGHEVIVSFLEGDPDRPLITGRLYHGNNMPPDALPDEKTKNVIRSWGDNDIVIEDKEGDKSIHIKQACGNEIIMHETTPNIEIKQECGNEILMRQAEGIQIRDKYGNEIVLDAVANFMRLYSPTHESKLELGKSIDMSTLSDWWADIKGNCKKEIKGNEINLTYGNKEDWIKGTLNAKWDGAEAKIHGGAVSDTFIGAKHESLVGTKVSVNASKEINKNALSRDRKSTGHIFYGSKDYIELVAAAGNEGKLKLDSKGALIDATGSKITVKKGGDINIYSKAESEYRAVGNISIKAGGGKKINLVATEVKAVKGKFTAKNIKDIG